jgi:catechol 2,3-dioxygenase-like lactoylglutathione lyase family enzyme
MVYQRSNTILYCRHWAETVRFYRDVLALPISFQNDWFVEFQLGAQVYLSIADERRASIDSVSGQGITLSWQVDDLQAARAELLAQQITLSEVRQKWGASLCYLHDPEGHRIELWQPLNS